ncbi:MAG: ornithine cyclodeaminase family protein [Nitrospirae bacterium]|nr:ornithine cyclodeaminase family protein [Nitrospirota bacterium]
MEIKVRVLGSRDLRQVARMREVMEAVEGAFRALAKGEAQMPSKLYVSLPEHEGDFRAMPAHLRHLNAAGLKWVTSYARNTSVPAVMGVYILSRADDGRPLAIMDGTYLTGLRTGAAAGVASRALARPESAVFSFVGCGHQARTAWEALRGVFRPAEVRLFDLNPQKAEEMVGILKDAGLTIKMCRSVTECAKGADVLTTTTPSRRPVVAEVDILPGTHINAMGADAKGKQELDAAILKRAVVVIDDWDQALHSGEVNVPLSERRLTRDDIRASLGEILIGHRPGRRDPSDVTVFDSTGLAVQDLAVAHLLYTLCVEAGLGAQVELYSEP